MFIFAAVYIFGAGVALGGGISENKYCRLGVPLPWLVLLLFLFAVLWPLVLIWEMLERLGT